MESPPYRGGERATTGRGLMLASSRYDGIVPAQSLSLMSLTTLKSRRWADEADGRARPAVIAAARLRESCPRRAGGSLSVSIDCAINVFIPYSRRRTGKVYPHEIDIQETHPKHRKLDSQTTLSHRARGRAPDGLRPKAWPLWASGCDHDPGGLPPRSA